MSSYGVMREGQSDNFYHPEADGGISILDESLGIDWRIPTEHANLSEKDTKHEVLKDFDSPFEYQMQILISKIIPSFFTIKEDSTSLTKPLSCPKREDVTALRCSEPLRSKVGGPSKVCAKLCGLGFRR